MVDLSQDPVEQLSIILAELEKARILVSKPKARIDIERRYMGTGLRIILIGRLIDCTMRNVEALLKSYRIMDAVVKISGEATLDEVEEAIFGSTTYKPAVIVANKIDLEGSDAKVKLLDAYVEDKLLILPVSCERRIGLGKLGEILYRTLYIMRIYTKEPNEKEFSKKPFILKKGSTVNDLAKSIHSDFSKNFSFAKIWAKRLVFSPQKVGSTFALDDGDIVEIHVK
jgi:ribosome-interacting GTPase 1